MGFFKELFNKVDSAPTAIPQEVAWVQEARKHIGTREIPGPRNEPKILQWWKAIKRGGIKSDAVPWCAAFVGGCLEAVGLVSSRYESARSYLTWGAALSEPVYGCIVIFSRKNGGHVGFVVGTDTSGRLMVLGGNQNDSVSIAPFNVDRVIGYRWPSVVPLTNQALPIVTNSAQSSVNEQ